MRKGQLISLIAVFFLAVDFLLFRYKIIGLTLNLIFAVGILAGTIVTKILLKAYKR